MEIYIFVANNVTKIIRLLFANVFFKSAVHSISILLLTKEKYPKTNNLCP